MHIEITKEITVDGMTFLFNKRKTGGFDFSIKIHMSDDGGTEKVLTLKGEDAIKFLGGSRTYNIKEQKHSETELEIGVCDQFVDALVDEYCVIERENLEDIIKEAYGITGV
jgi:hypothetical protein